MGARWFTYLGLGGMVVLLVGPAVAQTTGSGSSGAPASGAGPPTIRPVPTTPKPTESTSTPAPKPSGTTSIETAPSKGVPGSSQPGSAPTAPVGDSPSGTAQGDAEQVRAVQKALKDRGMHPGPVNGIMSRETQAAIRAFQKDQRITVTGQLDSQTREKLGVAP